MTMDMAVMNTLGSIEDYDYDGDESGEGDYEGGKVLLTMRRVFVATESVNSG
jgi:hypothetical protein